MRTSSDSRTVMETKSNLKVKKIACLFLQIQKTFETLPTDDIGIVQLFFDVKFSILDISEIYELDPCKIEKIISDFLVLLFDESLTLQRFLIHSCARNGNLLIDSYRQAIHVIETCEIPESVGARIRELVGTAIQIGIPAIPSDLLDRRISNANTIDDPLDDYSWETKPTAESSQTSQHEHHIPCCSGTSQKTNDVVIEMSYPEATTVGIAGDFNNWNPSLNPMQKVGNSGMWKASLHLSHGMYQYRLVVDGLWQQDPNNQCTEPNPFGGFNSVLRVE